MCNEHEKVLSSPELVDYTPTRLITSKAQRAVYEVSRGSERYALKLFRQDLDVVPYPFEVQVELLPALSSKSFRVLRVPNLVDSGFTCGWCFLLMEWLDGRDFFSKWHYRKEPVAGGRTLSVDYVSPIADVLSDLSTFDSAEFSKPMRISGGHYNKSFARGLSLLRGLLSSRQIALADLYRKKLTDYNGDRPWNVSNEDFRLWNMLELPSGEVGLVDWDGARVGQFELESCVAYKWIFMWHNPDWRKEWLLHARERFGLEKTYFRAILVERLLVQLYTWRNDFELRQMLIGDLLKVLSDRCFRGTIWLD